MRPGGIIKNHTWHIGSERTSQPPRLPAPRSQALSPWVLAVLHWVHKSVLTAVSLALPFPSCVTLANYFNRLVFPPLI